VCTICEDVLLSDTDLESYIIIRKLADSIFKTVQAKIPILEQLLNDYE
jgi:hypothetical protein